MPCAERAVQTSFALLHTGAVSGSAALIGQAKDGFAVPYYELGSREPRYISTLIVAISGKFTANGKEKIVHKLPPGLIGSVYFLDRENIIELTDRVLAKKLEPCPVLDVKS